MSTQIPKNFWAQQTSDLTHYFEDLLNTELTEYRTIDLDDKDCVPDLLPTAQKECIATSQMFFNEPWCNIDYHARETEVTRLYNEYCQIISILIGDQGVDMDVFFKINRETVYDDFPTIWDSPVFYELGEKAHLWIKDDCTWFLGVTQEDKELPFEIHFGCFSAQDMKVLSNHIGTFATSKTGKL